MQPILFLVTAANRLLAKGNEKVAPFEVQHGLSIVFSYNWI